MPESTLTPPHLPQFRNRDRVPAGPLRERVERIMVEEGVDWAEICWRIGWVIRPSMCYPYRRADVTRLKRRLGVLVYRSHGVDIRTRNMEYSTAVEIVRGLGLDPVDFGV